MTITRSVLFASLLGTAMFGCRNTSDNRDDMNRAPKPVESAPAAEPMKGGNATGTTTTGAPDPWATTGKADQGVPEGGATPAGTTPGTPGTPGTAGQPGTPGTPDTTPTPPPTPGQPGTTGSAENIPAPAATGSDNGAQGYNSDQGSAAVPSTGSAATPGSMDTYGSAAGSADQGTLDQRGGALNGNSKGDQSNQQP